MKTRMKMRVMFSAVFAGIFLATLSSPLVAQNVVSPGSSGSIQWEVDNDAQSGGPMTGVTITVPNPPSQFAVQQTSKLGPVDIAPGQNFVFQVDYTIDPNAPTGSFNVPLHMSQTTQFATHKMSDTSVSVVYKGSLAAVENT